MFNQWVEIASLYMEGKTEIWYESLLVGGNDLTTNLDELLKAVCIRFGNQSDIVGS
jgi:hypothetical protein